MFNIYNGYTLPLGVFVIAGIVMALLALAAIVDKKVPFVNKVAIVGATAAVVGLSLMQYI